MDAEFEIEDDEHEIMRLDDDIRQRWPSNGMACDVPSCNSKHFSTFRKYIKHWKQIHVQYIRIYSCDTCTAKFNRQCILSRHFRFVHKLNKSRISEKLNKLVCKVENNKYISPGNILPRINQ